VTTRLSEYHKVLSERKNAKILKDARDLVLATAKRFGKARFAQVAAKHVGLVNRGIPKYIRNAINWLTSDATE
jgi:putative ATP-dependent endonuclease of OLD family